MPFKRRSYRNLSRLPAWLLLGPGGRVVASVRAEDRPEAKRTFSEPVSSKGKVIKSKENQ